MCLCAWYGHRARGTGHACLVQGYAGAGSDLVGRRGEGEGL